MHLNMEGGSGPRTSGEGRFLDSVLPVLYDLASTIGAELTVKNLLAKTLLRFLYHTSFPAGFVCAPMPGAEDGAGGDVGVTVTAAAGDFRLVKALGATLSLPAGLFAEAGLQDGVGHLLDRLPCKVGQHKCFLRLNVPGYGFVFLFGPRPPDSALPLAHMFDPVLAHLGRALKLCAASDAQRASLVSERDELAGKQRLSARMLNSINSGIFVTDGRWRIVSVNAAFEKLTRYGQEAILGKFPLSFLSKRFNPAVFRRFSKQLEGNDNWVGEVNISDRQGRLFPASLTFSAVRSPEGPVTNYIGIFTDISEKKENEERINFLAFYDPLTRLPNLDLFKEKIEKQVAVASEATSFFVVSINIDNFNTINNSLGRARGDALLTKIAERLLDCLRESDVVARADADNFLVLLSGVRERETVVSIVKKIQGFISAPIPTDQDTVSVSSTAGISLFPHNGRDADTLLRHANTALKYAKASERGQFRFFASTMNKALMERFSMENHLRTAAEGGELALHYQPFVDLGTGLVAGVEALLRWQSPALGSVPPGSFIPVAEQSGLIVPLGDWVIGEACRQCAAWRACGLPIPHAAVNISAVQFKKSRIAETVARHLADNGLGPDDLELELTESIMIHNTEQSLKTVAELKTLGLKLSLDDFGTGYSSFSYLSRFPIDKLKIDQSFVRDLGTGPGAAKIVKAIIDLGASLGLQTIAEGVETPEQRDMLRNFGCGLAQGYLLSRPLAPNLLARLVAADGSLTPQ